SAKKQSAHAQQVVAKPSRNKLEPLDHKGSAGTTPRSRGGSDDSDSERKVSFREDPQVQQTANVGSATSTSTLTPPSGEHAGTGTSSLASGRDRQNSLSRKQRNGGASTAREPMQSHDATRESPRHEAGGATWRKVHSDTMMVPRIGSRDQDAWSESSFGYGRCDQTLDLTGRKFTRKAARGNLGSSTTLSSNTDNSDDAEDNFNVVLRVRPPNAQERNRRDQFIVDFPGDGQVSVNNQGTVRSFQFNVVLEPDAAQEDVFETSGMKKLIDAAIMGYTCTAFAFGQTGSGKTHTMTGPPAQ
ncbi:hypothetical protein EGW08_014445, partial [Elysia chlorotica]